MASAIRMTTERPRVADSRLSRVIAPAVWVWVVRIPVYDAWSRRSEPENTNAPDVGAHAVAIAAQYQLMPTPTVADVMLSFRPW